jgi:hypothetical protein
MTSPQCLQCTCKHVSMAYAHAVNAAVSTASPEYVRIRQDATSHALQELCVAHILLVEWKADYHEHRWMAMGHLGLAEEEIALKYPDAAKEIRIARKAFETDPDSIPDFKALLRMLVKLDMEERDAAYRPSTPQEP